MAKNVQTGNVQAGEDARFPLYAFFLTLRGRGFTATPEQIAEGYRVITEYAPSVKNITSLRDHLCPIFASGKDEQQKFRDIFNLYFPEPQIKVRKRNIFSEELRYFAAAAIFLTIAIGLLLYYLHKPIAILPKPAQIVTFSIVDLDSSSKAISGEPSFKLHTGEALRINIRSNPPNIPDTVLIHWGDHSARPDINQRQHIYNTEGEDTLKARISYRTGKNEKERDTIISRRVYVCSQTARLRIARSIEGSLRVGQYITIGAHVTGEQPDSILWIINGRAVKSAERLYTAFTNEGSYHVEAIAAFGDTSSFCSLKQYCDINVYDPGKISIAFNRAPNAEPIQLTHTVRSNLYYLLFILPVLSLLFFLYMLWLFKRRNKRLKRKKADEEDEYKKLLSGFAGTGQPMELPFIDKNYLVENEELLNDIARSMRIRNYEGGHFTDVGQTIKKAIENFGLIHPIEVHRRIQSEFLFLIGGHPAYNQQSRFFECFAEMLEKQNVFVNRFFFADDFKLFRNKEFPAGLSLEKLFDRFTSSIAVIFGNGYVLLHSPYPTVRDELMEQLSAWRSMAVVTPVPKADWGNREINVLPGAIAVFPFELQSQLQLMEKLVANDDGALVFENEHIGGEGISDLNFDNPEHLKRYAEHFVWANTSTGNGSINLIFQWIAAMAVYPQLRWELILAIGKAIFEEYSIGERFNISTLLIISRISWMNKSIMPVQLRLDLLTRLENHFEVIARKTILNALKEIPEDEITPTHFAYEEKRLQQITNEFILYSYDSVTYKRYEASKQLFKLLYADKGGSRITDATGLIYLQNEKGANSTLLRQSPDEVEPVGRYISLDDYFNTRPRSYNWMRILSAVPLILSIILIAAAFLLPSMGFNKFSPFKAVPYATYPVRFILQDSTEEHSLQNATLNFEDRQIDFDAKKRSITIALPPGYSGHLSLIGAGRTLLDTAAKLNYTIYNLIARDRNLIIRDSITYSQSNAGLNILRIFVYDGHGQPLNKARIIVTVPPAIQLKNKSSATGTTDKNGLFIMPFTYSKSADKLRNQVMQVSASYKQFADRLTINTIPHRDPRPWLYIFYTDSTQYATMKKLLQCLTASGQFVLNPPIWHKVGAGGDTLGTQVRYFRKAFADSVKTIQACLKSNLPDLNFTSELQATPSKPGDAVEIWISSGNNRKPENKSPAGTTLKSDTLNLGIVQTAPPGAIGFDINTRLSAANSAAFFKAGYSFCVRYLPRTPLLNRGNNNLINAEAHDILNSGLALMAVQHAALPEWVPTATLGTAYGRYAAEYARQIVGLPTGMNIWCDLEQVAPRTPATEVIAYCKAWYDAVKEQGYVPGLFVGYGSVLNAKQVNELPFKHFWREYNGGVVPKRGFQIIQSTQKSLNGLEFDPNIAQPDSLGGSVLWLKK